jgi:hypothetical protein
MKSTGRTFKIIDQGSRVSYRIIDVATGQIKFSDLYSRVNSGQGQSVNFAAIAKRAAHEIGQKIQNAIFPILIESVSNGVVYLGQGGSTVKIGQRFKLVKLGRKLKDSYTKESLGRTEVEIGLVEIIDVQAKQSRAKIIKSKINIEKKFQKRGFLIRPLRQSSRAAVVRVKEVEKDLEKEFNELEKKSDKDW